MPAKSAEAPPGREMRTNTCSTLRIGKETKVGLNLVCTTINVPLLRKLELVLIFLSHLKVTYPSSPSSASDIFLESQVSVYIYTSCVDRTKLVWRLDNFVCRPRTFW
jgi:hypothetical protein